MPKTSRPMTVHPITVRELRVVRVLDVTPGMRRVTFGGSQLGEFTSSNGFARPAFSSPGFDDSVRLMFPYPGEVDPVLPIQKEGGVAFRPGRRPLARAYSVRRWDPDAAELDVDFVRHGVGGRHHMGLPGAARGPAAHGWAQRVERVSGRGRAPPRPG